MELTNEQVRAVREGNALPEPPQKAGDDFADDGLPTSRTVAGLMRATSDDGDERLPDVEDEWLEWYRLTPLERWEETKKLWAFFLSVGGSLDPEPDSQSPFYFEPEPRAVPIDGGPSLRVVRRGGV